MINYIWSGMIIAGVFYGTITGNMEGMTNASLESAQEAIALCITMLGVIGFWMGLMEVASKAGLVEEFAKGIQPLITFLFPRIPKNHPSRAYISTNVIANVLGLGWAATPAGLEAMKSLEDLEEGRRNGSISYDKRPQKKGIASNEMCTFLIINISSLQLIPMTIIAYRSEYGSNNPSSIILPCIIATTISTIVGILYAKYKDWRVE
ncbi:MAG: nucleoside recognition protein [Eubacteriales bacterium]